MRPFYDSIRRLAPAFCSACCVVGSVAAAPAEPAARARVVWERGPDTESCMTPVELEAAVESRLGRKLFAVAGAEPAVTLRVKLERLTESGRFHAQVWVDAADARALDTRDLEVGGEDCRALDEPLALVVSLIADSELALKSRETLAEPAPDPEYEAILKKPVLTVPSLQAPEPVPWQWQSELDFITGLGLLPDPSAGLDVSALVVPPRFVGVLAHAATFYPDEEELDGSGSVSFWLGYAGVALCPELVRASRVMLRGCIGADAGAMRVRSRGLVGAGTTYRLVVQSQIALRGTVSLGGDWLAGAMVATLLPLRPETFRYQRADGRTEKVFQMAHLGLVLGLGVGFGFR
jgi:hypothetical protein